MLNTNVNFEVLAEEQDPVRVKGDVASIACRGLDLFARGMGKGLKSRLRALAPSKLTKHRILSGPLRNCWIVTSWQHYYTGILGTVERGLIAWFNQNVKAGETWIDIGANYGYTALMMRRLAGPGGRVFAFEPKLSTAGCLSQTMLLNNLSDVTIVPMGLAFPETLGVQHLLTVGGMVAQNPSVSGTAVPESIECVFTARFDWLWPRLCGPIERIDGMKIDVQGMELEVLQGMKTLLKIHRPKLVVEFHQGVDRVLLLDLLESCGYSRQGRPIYSVPGEEREPQYHDNLSYVFTGQ